MDLRSHFEKRKTGENRTKGGVRKERKRTEGTGVNTLEM